MVRFQSLLCWTQLLNPTAPRRRKLQHRCFTPCCVGLSSSTGSLSYGSYQRSEFQSLLCWTQLLNREGQRGGADRRVHVSILVVLDSAPQRGRAEAGHCPERVSILV